MATFTKIELSGSTDGRPIAVAATSGTGTTIHTATTGTTENNYDEIWLWAGCIDSVPRILGLQIGGTTSGDHIETVIPARGSGPILVCPGWPLQNGLLMRATAAAANVVNLVGYVNRIHS